MIVFPFESECAPPYFEKLPFFGKLPFLRNYRFWQITVFDKLSIFLYINTAGELVGGNYNFSTATEIIGYLIRERIGTTLLREITVFENYRFWEITVSAKFPFLRNYRFENFPFWEIVDFLFVHLYCRRACSRQLLFYYHDWNHRIPHSKANGHHPVLRNYRFC